jgi:hypothetical protein
MSFAEAEKKVIHLLGNVLEEDAVSTRSSDDPTSRPGWVSERRQREEGGELRT